jgi:membrane protease YdiL (CAAX protease family)
MRQGMWAEYNLSFSSHSSMDPIADKQGMWKSRDAWLCVLVLIVAQFIILFWLHFGARNSPAFDHWWATPFGSGVIYFIQDALWLFVALWFSRVEAIRDFLGPAGLLRRVSIFGWIAAWLATLIALLDDYGAARGLTASSGQPQPVGYGALSAVWCYFTLSSVLIAPFCEEVVTRGFLFHAFRGRYNFFVTTAIIICFSAWFHRSSVTQSVFTFACLASLWVLLCILRERTGSLWDCLLCHAAYNLVVIHLCIPAAIIMMLFLPFVVYPIFGKQRETVIRVSDRDA